MRAPALLLVAVLLAAALPLPATGQDRRCIGVPEWAVTYEWAYDLQDGTTRFEEVIRHTLTTTRWGHYNVTTMGYAEFQDEERQTWGREMVIRDGGAFPLGLVSRDGWSVPPPGSDQDQRELTFYEPPLQIVHHHFETCPGRVWDLETVHTLITGNPPAQGERNETWQVRALQWETVTVPAGTFEALRVRAVRLNDLWTVESYWSPEVRNLVKQEKGPQNLPPVETKVLSWFLLDQRPAARFKVEPRNPVVGDDVVLNATPSHDPEGPIVEYRWAVGDEEHRGPIVTLEGVQEGVIPVRLFVTDTAGRTTTLGTTVYVAPRAGEGIAVWGPLAAKEGDVVTLEAKTPFDPVRVRWRANDSVVGDGPVYSFRQGANGTTLAVDAFHVSGRVFTANHTVALIPDDHQPPTAGEPRAFELPDRWPRGGSEVLALLSPLEGQVVARTLRAHVWTSGDAVLRVDGEQVWAGGGPEAFVELDLAPGRHQLSLEGSGRSMTANVTVPGLANPPQPDPDEPVEPAPTPFPVLAVLAVLAAVSLGMRRRS